MLSSRNEYSNLLPFFSIRLPASLEESFRKEFARYSLLQMRYGIVAALVIIILFGIYNGYYAFEQLALVLTIHFGVICPVVVALLLATYHKGFMSRMQELLFAAILIVGLAILALTFITPNPNDYQNLIGTLVYSVGAYTAVKLRFQYATIAGLGLAIVYLLLAWYVGNMDLPQWITHAFFLLAINGVGMTAAFQMERSLKKNYLQALDIDAERSRSEDLLLSILPQTIAERLMDNPDTIADQFTHASILFADIVNFTPLSANMEPQQIVSLLNDIFSRFDLLVERYDLEKIKTIGDAYMVAAGIPIVRDDHAEAMARMALDMQSEVNNFEGPAGEIIQIRIGINSGTVVAGVIGLKKFIYDLWGDAVNVASRMETHGLPGKIQVSSTTHDLLKAHFEFESRGKLEIKGHGKLDTWLLIGERVTKT